MRKLRFLLAVLWIWMTLLLPAGTAPAGEETEDPARGLEEILKTDKYLDDELRRLALDAGQGVNFTLAAGRGLRTDILLKLVEVYRAALEKDPSNPLAAAGLARALSALGRSDQAAEAYERAIALNSTDPRLPAELRALHLANSSRISATYSTGVTREYWPLAERHIYQVHQTTWQVQGDTPVGELWRLGAGWLRGSIRQESLIYGDDDFDLTRNGAFLTGQFQPRPELNFRFRLGRETYSNDNGSSYYQMPDDEELWTGYGLAQYQDGPWWVNASFTRERDTWPMVDGSTGRGVLRVLAQELYGLAGGRSLAPGWEANASLFYEQYGSDRPDQFNINGQVLHRPPWLPQARIGLGVGHYTEEPETLANLLLGWQWSPLQGLALDLSWQWEYSQKESSWLGMGQALLTWRPHPRLGFNLLGGYGREHQDDQDDWWSLDLSLEYRF